MTETEIEAVARELCIADGLDPDADALVSRDFLLPLSVRPEGHRMWTHYRNAAIRSLRIMSNEHDGEDRVTLPT